MSFAQLEDAARQSIEANEEDDVGKKGPGQRAGSKSKGGKTGPPPREDEMQVYLSEIRQK